MIIRWGEIWTICWVGKMPEFQFSKHFNGHHCYMRSGIVMMQNNSICQHYSVFPANSGFQLLFKHSTMLCTIDHLSTIMVVLEDGPIKVPVQHQHHCWQIAHF
jgi:hypothetical protein